MAEAEAIQESGQQVDTTKIQDAGVTQDASVRQEQQATPTPEQSSQPAEQQQKQKSLEFNPDFTFELDQATAHLTLIITVPAPSGNVKEFREFFQFFPTMDESWRKFSPILYRYVNNTKGLTYDRTKLEAKLFNAIDKIDKKAYGQVYDRVAEEKEKAREEQRNAKKAAKTSPASPASEAQPVQPIDRANNFTPYFITKTKGDAIEIVDICNFNVVFNRLLKIDNDAKLYDCTINYNFKKNGVNEKDKLKNIEVGEKTFHDKKEVIAFFAKYSQYLWLKKGNMPDVLTEINIDETTQFANGTIEEIQKTQHFGWNKDFTKYCTPSLDYELKMVNGVPDYNRQYGHYELVDQYQRYIEKYEIDTHDPDAYIPKDLGSVKILNPTISEKLKLGFRATEKPIEENLMHVKTKLLELSPTMHRIIPIVTIAPLSSMLEITGNKYQMYIRGHTGFGKTQEATLMMNFFADVEDDKTLMNILRDKPNAIEEIGFYHKDCLFVIDNFKESAIDRREIPKVKAFLQSIADRQGTRRMSTSGFGSFNIRGTTLVTGEEILQDASTIRKYDVVTIKEKVNTEILKECHAYRKNYSSITGEYIKWLLKTYGDQIQENIKSRIEKYSIFSETVLTLNAVGYELFLDFMLYHKAIKEAEYQEWLKVHVEKLKEDDAAKQREVHEKTTAQLFKDTVTAMVTAGDAEIKGDLEYNKRHIKEIGQASDAGEAIVFWEKMYPVVKGYAYRNGVTLPDDFDSVIESLTSEYGVFNQRSSARVPGKDNPTKLPSFARKDLLPYSTSNGYMSMDDIVSLMPTIIEDKFAITAKPTPKQYNEVIDYLVNDYTPGSEKKTDTAKANFMRDVTPLLKAYFKGKYGRDWTIPV